MSKTTWKVLAIIFMILFLFQTSVWIWAYYEIIDDERKSNICFYDVCEMYPQTHYEADVCTCYDYDIASGWFVTKTEYFD